MNKICTSLEQSKKLIELGIDRNTADMYYSCGAVVPDVMTSSKQDYKCYTVCWSLAALFNLCPTINGKQPILTRGKLTRLWYCYYEDEIDTQTYDNPIDACYEMIIRLKEMNFL